MRVTITKEWMLDGAPDGVPASLTVSPPAPTRLPPIAITAPPHRQRTTPTADGYLSAKGPPANATNNSPMIAALPTRALARRVISVVGVGATDS